MYSARAGLSKKKRWLPGVSYTLQPAALNFAQPSTWCFFTRLLQEGGPGRTLSQSKRHDQGALGQGVGSSIAAAKSLLDGDVGLEWDRQSSGNGCGQGRAVRTRGASAHPASPAGVKASPGVDRRVACAQFVFIKEFEVVLHEWAVDGVVGVRQCHFVDVPSPRFILEVRVAHATTTVPRPLALRYVRRREARDDDLSDGRA